MADLRIPLESTRLKLEELRRLLLAEEGVLDVARAKELYKKVFNPTGDITKEFSKLKTNYPSYFKGVEISTTTSKFRNYLLNRAKNLKAPITTSIPALQKAAGSNLGTSDAWSVLNRLDKNVKAKFELGKDVATSQYDKLYANQKNFRNYFNEAFDTPWSKAEGFQKGNAWKQFQNIKNKKIPAGYTTSNNEILKLLGITKSSLDTMISAPEKSTSAQFIKENLDFKRGPAAAGEYRATTGTSIRHWKKPSELTLRKWKQLKASTVMSADIRENVIKLNKKFRKLIIDQKKLPTLFQVQEALGNKSPSTAANSMVKLANIYKGDPLRVGIDIETKVPAG